MTVARLFSVVLLRMVVLLFAGAGVAIALGFLALLRGSDMSASALWLIAVGVPTAAVLISLSIVMATMRPWRYLRDMDSMVAGAAWAHWRYDEAQWRAANRVEGRRNRRTGFTSALIALVLGLLLAAVGVAVDGEDSSILVFAGVLTAALSCLAVFLMIAASPDMVVRARKRGEIYISSLGIYRRPGGYTALYSFGVALCDVEFVVAAPSYLRFDAMVVSGGSGATIQRWADVAVPAGCEEDARQLVERFRQLVGSNQR